MRRFTLLATAVTVLAGAAGAQETRTVILPEVRPFAGVLIPTGAMRDDFKTAETFGAQLALEMSPRFHVVGSLAWTHGHHKFAALNDRTNVWQYDAGIEVNPFQPTGTVWQLRPFVGIGGGARTNAYRTVYETTTCLAGYGTIGTELQRGIVAFRVEGRDYLSCQKSPVTGIKKTRNDILLNFGLALHLH